MVDEWIATYPIQVCCGGLVSPSCHLTANVMSMSTLVPSAWLRQLAPLLSSARVSPTFS